MPNCSVFRCKKRSESSNLQKDNVTFHLFPKDAMIRDVWIRACANHDSWTPKRTSTICSEHFEASCFKTQANNKRRLIEHAVPTLKLPKEMINSEQFDSESIIIKIETPDDPNPSYICETIYVSPKPTHNNQQLQDTLRERKLKQLLQMKNKQIKRLQTQNRYFKKKVAGLQELLNDRTEKSLINPKEDPLILDNIDAEDK